MKRAERVAEDSSEERGGPLRLAKAQRSDDEWADDLPVSVPLATAANPIAADPTAVSHDTRAPSAVLSDAEVSAVVDAHLRAHDTFAAIQHVQNVLEARAAMSAIPAVVEQEAGEQGRQKERDDDVNERWAGQQTRLVSFDDLPVRCRDDGPQPVFSAWVGAATQ